MNRKFKIGDRVTHSDLPKIAGTIWDIHESDKFEAYFVDWDSNKDPRDAPYDVKLLSAVV